MQVFSFLSSLNFLSSLHYRARRYGWYRVGIVISFVVSLSACSTSSGPTQDETKLVLHKPVREVRSFDEAIRNAKRSKPESPIVKVGMLLPLSGRNAELGQLLRNIASQALFDHRAENLILRFGDTSGHPQGVLEATRTLLDEGVHLILGPLFLSEANAIKPMVSQARVPMLTFSNDIRLRDETTYVLGLSPVPQIERLISYIISQDEEGTSEETATSEEVATSEETATSEEVATSEETATSEEVATSEAINEENKPKRFALLVPHGTYGQTIIQAASEVIERHNGMMVRTVTYLNEANNIQSAVRKVINISLEELRERHNRKRTLQQQDTIESITEQDELRPLVVDFDVLILADNKLWRLDIIFDTLQESEIDRDTYLVSGTSLWERIDINNIPELIGGLFAAPPPDRWRSFNESFKQLYGSLPPRQATLIYDAVHLVSRFADISGIRGQIDLAELTQLEISGLDGILSLKPQGIIERELVIYEIRAEGLRIIDPPPAPDTEEIL